MAKMMDEEQQNIDFVLFSDNLKLYSSILDDIENAQHHIYIETYKYGADAIGVKFKDALIRKAKLGVEVKVLIDAWGTSVTPGFFNELIHYGGEVRFFKKIHWGIDFISKNHKRDHRKILVIDHCINYIGSANFSDYSINWRELTLRINNPFLAKPLIKLFISNFRLNNVSILKRTSSDKIRMLISNYIELVPHTGFEIIKDVPSTIIQPVKRKFLEMIKKAQHSIVVETPYFLPTQSLRKELLAALKRGVDIKIIVPKHSDVMAVDILRSRYLGMMYKEKAKIYFYTPQNLHSKLLIIDNTDFAIGSSNFDYRSFRFQYEVVLKGNDLAIIKCLNQHVNNTLKDSVLFDYEQWKKRPVFEKIIELALIPIRHFF